MVSDTGNSSPSSTDNKAWWFAIRPPSIEEGTLHSICASGTAREILTSTLLVRLDSTALHGPGEGGCGWCGRCRRCGWWIRRWRGSISSRTAPITPFDRHLSIRGICQSTPCSRVQINRSTAFLINQLGFDATSNSVVYRWTECSRVLDPDCGSALWIQNSREKLGTVSVGVGPAEIRSSS